MPYGRPREWAFCYERGTPVRATLSAVRRQRVDRPLLAPPLSSSFDAGASMAAVLVVKKFAVFFPLCLPLSLFLSLCLCLSLSLSLSFSLSLSLSLFLSPLRRILRSFKSDHSPRSHLHVGILDFLMGTRGALRKQSAFRGTRDGICDYRGTSLIRNTPLIGPYRRTIPRVLWWF